MPETSTEKVSAPDYPGALIPIQYHAVMLGDELRMNAFETAINMIVKPGMNVVDLGAGTGVLSFMCARAGAKVWSVERLHDLANVAKELIDVNGMGDKITVVEASAEEFIPPEPIDVVVCEMLHVALLREKQIEVIDSFKKNHLAAHGEREIIFIPDTTFQAVQPIQHDFDYHGYVAPIPLMQQADALQARSVELGVPTVYQTVVYNEDLPSSCAWSGQLAITQPGTVNALRFITKSVLAVDVEKQGTVDWFMQYLIVPMSAGVEVGTSDTINVSFSYKPGDEINVLQESLVVGK